MVGSLLLRGMLAGILAAIIAFGFAQVFGEPAVNLSIAFEEASGAEHSHGEAPAPATAAAPAATAPHAHGGAAAPAPASAEEEEELVSRGVQATLGLFIGLAAYSAAMGGVFALVFAYLNGRVGNLSPRALSAVLALTAFVVLILLPGIKYPANPPAVGDPATIGLRTSWFFILQAISVVGVIAAALFARGLSGAMGGWNAAILGGVGYLVLVAAVAFAAPSAGSAPEGFPADLLWQFRLASWGLNAVIWAVIGLAFGAFAEAAQRQPAARVAAAR
ncbi:CbtA family protein [Xanthobacteraceae bacterium A53D]